MKTDNFWSDKFTIWDNFVREDYIRNKLIIPHLIDCINQNQGNSLKIADIGCGTGYIPHIITSLVEKINTCFCLDIDEYVIQHAKNKYINSKLEFLVHNIFKEFPVANLDIIYSIFTLMEFKLSEDVCYNIFNSITNHGHLLVYVPDFLIDIQKNKDNYNINEYIEGCLTNTKIDKKTKIEYPFFMNRIEFIIESFLKVGFSMHMLYKLEFTDSNERNRIFSLHFVKH